MEKKCFETKERKEKFQFLSKSSHVSYMRGKYNRIIFLMLNYSKYQGKYKCDYKEFKNILEIPKSYRESHINTKILNLSKIEIPKFGFDILEINKIKKGRSIDEIEIIFNKNSNYIEVDIKPYESHMVFMEMEKFKQ